MQLGVIADDFTGASDVANTLARGGLSTALAFNRCPGSLPQDFDACVVALKTRSIPAAEAVRQSLDALDGLAALGAQRFLFKYCSTFDSTPKGNIGPVTEALAARLGADGAVVLCPAFPDAGRTVFQGHLFVFDRLLSQSGMENHPLNPMTESDLRRWLALQTAGAVGHLPLAIVRSGREAIQARLGEEAAAGRRLVIADAVENADLMLLGEAIADDPLTTGGSGVAMGIAPRLAAGAAAKGEKGFAPVAGPGLVLAGSCSSATRGQVAAYRPRHPSFQIDADDLMAGRLTAGDIAVFVGENLAAGPLVTSSTEPEAVRAAQQRHGAEVLAERLERLFGEVAQAAVAAGVTRLVVAGGETSGAGVTALVIPLLAVGPVIAVGVPALSALDRRLALALKSGNFGGPDFFEAALGALGGG
jgi:uncharacterized protein YgbK (DUF1537 family)